MPGQRVLCPTRRSEARPVERATLIRPPVPMVTAIGMVKTVAAAAGVAATPSAGRPPASLKRLEVKVVAKLPYDPVVTRAMVDGVTVVERSDGEVSSNIRRLWERLPALVTSL